MFNITQCYIVLNIMSEFHTILHLPDEILLIIFGNLSAEDKVRAALVCLRFGNVLTSPELIRSLNFAASYATKNKLFRSFFMNKERCENVTELDITSCYWLKNHEIVPILRKLKNLNSLYAADTVLDFGKPQNLIDATPKLRRLSCSWYSVPSYPSYGHLLKWVSSLKFLYLLLDSAISLSSLTYILQYCDSLEELWLVWTNVTTMDYSSSAYDMKNIRLPQLNKLVVLLPPLSGTTYHHSYNYVSLLFATLTKVPRSWKCYAANMVRSVPSDLSANDFTEVESLFGAVLNEINGDVCKKKLNKLKFYGNLNITKHLLSPQCLENVMELNLYRYHQNDIGKITELPSKLRQFNLRCCASKEPQLCSILSNLNVLDVTHCILKSDKPTSSTSSVTHLAKGSRIGFTVNDATVPALEKLTSSNPQLKELYLRKCSSCSGYESVQYLSRWNHLEKLSLEELSTPIGPYLNQIFSSCSNLRSVSLMNLDVPAMLRYRDNLNTALPKLGKLLDFRLDHLYIGKMNDILMSLCKCPLIQRVTFTEHVNCKTLKQEAILSVSTLQTFLEQAEDCIFLCIMSPNITKNGSKNLVDMVKLRYAETRPALTVVFNIPNMGEIKNCRSIPAIHFTEMMYPKKFIPNVPFHRSRYISHYK